MERTTLSVIEDFATSRDERVRRNVCTALATLGTEEALVQLTRLGLSDEDEAVQNRFEQELYGVDKERQGVAIGLLHKALEDESSRIRAFHLLSRLSRRGVAAIKPHATLGERVRDLLRTRGIARSEAGRISGGLSFRTAAVGAAAGAVSFLCGLLLVTVGYELAPGVYGLLLSSFILGLIICMVLPRLSVPLGVHFDRTLEIFGELAIMTAAGAAAGLVCFAVVFFIWLTAGEEPGEVVQMLWYLPLLSSATVLAVRAGTLLAQGTVASRIRLRLRRDATGVSAGLIAVTAVSLGFAEVSVLGSVPEITWGLACPVAIALAHAFVTADGQPRRGLARRLPRLVRQGASLSLIALVLAGGLAAAYGERSAEVTRAALQVMGATNAARPGKMQRSDMAVPLGFKAQFETRFPQEVEIIAPDPPVGYELYLYSQDDQMIAHEEKSSGEALMIRMRLFPGTYKFMVCRRGGSEEGESLDAGEILPELRRRVKRLFSRQEAISEDVITVKLVLNVLEEATPAPQEQEVKPNQPSKQKS